MTDTQKVKTLADYTDAELLQELAARLGKTANAEATRGEKIYVQTPSDWQARMDTLTRYREKMRYHFSVVAQSRGFAPAFSHVFLHPTATHVSFIMGISKQGSDSLDKTKPHYYISLPLQSELTEEQEEAHLLAQVIDVVENLEKSLQPKDIADAARLLRTDPVAWLDLQRRHWAAQPNASTSGISFGRVYTDPASDVAAGMCIWCTTYGGKHHNFEGLPDRMEGIDKASWQSLLDDLSLTLDLSAADTERSLSEIQEEVDTHIQTCIDRIKKSRTAVTSYIEKMHTEERASIVTMYRQSNIKVRAMQFWGERNAERCANFVGPCASYDEPDQRGNVDFRIETADGYTTVHSGQWLVEGTEGEISVVDNVTFQTAFLPC